MARALSWEKFWSISYKVEECLILMFFCFGMTPLWHFFQRSMLPFWRLRWRSCCSWRFLITEASAQKPDRPSPQSQLPLRVQRWFAKNSCEWWRRHGDADKNSFRWDLCQAHCATCRGWVSASTCYTLCFRVLQWEERAKKLKGEEV